MAFLFGFYNALKSLHDLRKFKVHKNHDQKTQAHIGQKPNE